MELVGDLSLLVDCYSRALLVYPTYSTLPLFCFVPPYHAFYCSTLGCDLNPKPNSNVDCKKVGGIVSVKFFIGFHS
jgi:hypothetical protein